MRRIAIGGAVLVALGAALWWRCNDPAAPEAEACIERPREQPLLVHRGRAARSVDRSERYRLALAVDMQPLDGSRSGSRVEVSGELMAIAAPHDLDARERVRFAFTGSARTSVGPLSMPGLTDAFDAYFEPDGRLAGFAFPDSTAAIARNMFASVVAQLQLVGGTGSRWEARWEADEVDALGSYHARYTSDNAHLTRTKLAYTRLVDPSLAAAVERADAQIVLAADGWPRSIASREQLELGTEHAKVRVTTTLGLDRIDDAPSSAPPPLKHAFVATTALGRDRDLEAAADRDLVDGATLDDLLAARAKITDDQHAAGYQYLRIAALFRIDAAAAVEGGRRLRTTNDAEEVRVLAGALGDSGSPAAVRVLGGLARDTGLDDGRRGQAVVALGLTPNPTDDAVAALRAIVHGPGGELADAAWLAFGSLALRLRVTDPTTAAAIVDDILATLHTATDDTFQLTLVRALGNSGDPRIIATLAPLATSTSPLLRATSLASLRLVPSDDSARLLLAGLADGNADVRASAIYAIGFHPPTTYVDPVTALYRREPTVDVRREIIVVAAANLEIAAYHGLLEAAAKSDADSELRELAARALRS